MTEASEITEFRDIRGHGRMLRKEDKRFVRGMGRYCDDLQLPGMLHLAVLRSPLAHARLVSIDTSAAEAHPKVKAVVTGAMLAERGLAWMPTLSGDVQAVLATDKVRFQGQEVAFVVAEDRYAARDALELIDVDYDVLEPVVDVRHALDPESPLIRDDIEGKTDNHCFDWETGDAAETAAVFARAEVTIEQEIVFPRVHPAPLETCGAVADYDRIEEKLTLTCTTQAPHVHRTLYADYAGIPEHRIRIIAPDIGGGFGNKVPIYPGYVCAIVGSMITGRPVKWTEDRTENLTASGFARDYIMKGEIAASKDGRILAVRSHVLADHGAFNGTAAPMKFPGGFFGVFTGSYDLEAAYCSMTAVHTNKAPGGVAYACSFRIAEAVYLVERLVDLLADELGVDPVALRLQNFLRPEQFPYTSRTGWIYDSGDYETTMREALRIAGYDDLRREQAEKRERAGEAGQSLMGIGVSFFTEAVGAGPRDTMDMAGLAMADGCEVRIHPSGKAVVRLSVTTQGQGHETTFAQIVAEEIGIHPDDIDVVQGDTDNTPYGLGTYGSRSTPVSGAAAVLVTRKIRDKARLIAAHMLEVAPRRPGLGQGHLQRPRRPRSRGDDPGRRPPRTRLRWPARRDGGRARGADLLQPEQPHLPVRRLHLRGRRRPRDGRGEGAPVRRRRRLRHPHQRDDRRGADPGRAHRRCRHRADGDRLVRQGRQLPQRVAHGLPDPDRARGPGLGDTARPSRPRHITRSARRASVSQPPSAPRRRS